jgi:hypothetical protein
MISYASIPQPTYSATLTGHCRSPGGRSLDSGGWAVVTSRRCAGR